MEQGFFLALGVAIIFGFLLYAVKAMPRSLAWIGVAAGVALMILDIANLKAYAWPTLIAFVGLFCIVGAGLWIHHIYQTRTNPLSDLVEAKKTTIIKSPKLQATIPQLITGGIDPARPADVGATFIMTISNVGDMQSFASDWRVRANWEGKEYIGTVRRINKAISLQIVGSPQIPGEVVTYTEEDAIYNKAANPIQPGQMTQGVLFSTFRVDREIMSKATFTILFRDVLGTEYSVQATPGVLSAVRTYPLIKPIER